MRAGNLGYQREAAEKTKNPKLSEWRLQLMQLIFGSAGSLMKKVGLNKG